MNFTGLVATFTDSQLPAWSYQATIAWGDGTSSGGWGQLAEDGVWEVRGSHTYSADGTYSLSVRINRVHGANIVTGGNAVVFSVPPIRATEGSPTGDQVLSTFFAECSTVPSLTATVWWGDGTTSDTWPDVRLEAEPGFCDFGWPGMTQVDLVGNHTYAEPGSYPIMFWVDDGTTIVDSGSTRAIVADATFSVASKTVYARQGLEFFADGDIHRSVHIGFGVPILCAR